MKAGDPRLPGLLNVALQAAQVAGKTLAAQRGTGRSLRFKPGPGSEAARALTDADLASQAVILRHLEPSLESGALALLAEESADDGSRLTRAAFWCVDPLDGTLPFSEGRDGFAVSIALVARDGTPLLGVVFDAAAGVCYHALAGGGAFRDGVPWRVGRTAPGDRLTWIHDRSLHDDARFPACTEAMRRLAAERGFSGIRVIEHGGAVMHALWTVTHAPAVYHKPPRTTPGGGALWDYAATACIVREAGGTVSDAYGKALALNRADSVFLGEHGVLYASEAGLAKQAGSLAATRLP